MVAFLISIYMGRAIGLVIGAYDHLRLHSKLGSKEETGGHGNDGKNGVCRDGHWGSEWSSCRPGGVLEE